MVYAHLPEGRAISYDIDAFSIMLLDADREEDGGEAIVDALAECDRQRVPHRVVRAAQASPSDDGTGIQSIIIASSPDALALAVAEFKARHSDIAWE
jgi:hypothetical protein